MVGSCHFEIFRSQRLWKQLGRVQVNRIQLYAGSLFDNPVDTGRWAALADATWVPPSSRAAALPPPDPTSTGTASCLFHAPAQLNQDLVE